jgi:hypothetical protein
MTAQISDILQESGKKFELLCEPRLPADRQRLALRRRQSKSAGILRSTACWRGYQATWRIRDGRLFLVRIAGDWHLKGKEPLFARWITAVLRIAHGRMLGYVHMGYASVYEWDELVAVEQGKVTQRIRIDNRDVPDPVTHASRITDAVKRMGVAAARHACADDGEEWVELGLCQIAGTGHHGDETTGRRLQLGWPLTLLPEPDNPHDANAIAVHLGRLKIGYVPRDRTAGILQVIREGRHVRANVIQVADPDAGPWLDATMVIESRLAGGGQPTVEVSPHPPISRRIR